MTTHRLTRPSGLLLVAGVLASSGLYSCSAGQAGSGEGQAAEVEIRDPNEPGVFQIGPNLYEAVVVAFEGGFDPSELRFPVGAEVRFRVRSVDLVHGFLIEGTDIEVEVDPLEPPEASYTFTEPGEYLMHCYIYCGGGHPSMLGTVIVE